MNKLAPQLTPRPVKNRLLCLCIALCIFSGSAMAQDEAQKEAQQLAWNFTLKSQTGENIKLSELRGQVIALNFWASWCGTCIQQFPLLKAYHQKNKNRGFTVLSVNIDEDLEKVSRLIQKRKFAYPVLFDPQNQVSRLYPVDDLPTLFLIDRDGHIRYSLDDEKIRQQKITQQVIEGLLNE